MTHNALHLQRAVTGVFEQMKASDEKHQYALLTQLLEKLPEEIISALAFAYDVKKTGQEEKR